MGFSGTVQRVSKMTGLEIVAKSALEIVVKQELQKFFKRRADESLRMVIEEMRTAKVDPSEVAEREGVAAMLVTFFMAMAQGAAFKNLRLMAKVLAYKSAHAGERQDDFMMWSEAIAGLLHEEVVLLATLHRNTVEASEGTSEPSKVHQQAVAATKAELVGRGKLLASNDEFEALCGALARTGFVILVSAWGGMTVAPSPRLARLARMADLQEWADEAAE